MYTLTSAEKPARLLVEAESLDIHADGDDLAYINITVSDEKGIPVVSEDYLITVSVEGAGVLEALGSADIEGTGNFHSCSCKSFHGRLLAVVRSDGGQGTITIRANAKGIKAGCAVIEAK